MIDIYPEYGDQSKDWEFFNRECKNIDIIWLWATNDEMEECSYCGEYFPEDELENCDECGLIFCENCLQACENPECLNKLCPDCARMNDGLCLYCRDDDEEEYSGGAQDRKRLLVVGGLCLAGAVLITLSFPARRPLPRRF